ncbi:hypothetical protein HDZ31DRAFT_66207 [Schizophyllum fasciatum]
MVTISKTGELPFELEWAIVEVTVRFYPEAATALALVSFRFKVWVEALLYETIVVDDPLTRPLLLLRTIDDRSPDFFARTVKRVYITTSIMYHDAARILTVCSGATDITCWTCPGPEFPNFDRVRRLSFDAPSLLFSPRNFPHLTHLDLVNPSPNTNLQAWTKFFTGLPVLTHVSFGNLYAREPVDHRPLIPLFTMLLKGETGHALALLVIISDDEDFVPLLREEADDARVVVLPQFNYPRTLEKYWQDVQRGGPDFWGVAESMLTGASRTTR